MGQVCNIRNCSDKAIFPVYFSTDSTSFGGTDTLYSSDVGKFVQKTTSANNAVILVRGTTANRAPGGAATTTMQILGFIHSVPQNTTVGSTKPVYIRRMNPMTELEISYSTLYSSNLPATTDIGAFIGLSNTTTIAGACLSMGGIGTSQAGTTSGRFIRISGFDNNRRKIFGYPVLESSAIDW